MAVSKRGKKYWLVKCEFDECSFDELKQRPQSTGYWRGVRNYQARNLIRDDMGEGGSGVLLSLQLRRAGDCWNRDDYKSGVPRPKSVRRQARLLR